MRNPKIDSYIDSAPEFAAPIIVHLRELAHRAFPKIEETIKWGMPHFEHKGLVFGIAAHKNYASVTFHKSNQLTDKHKIFNMVGKSEMGALGKIKTLDDLPSDEILMEYILESIEVNKKGVKPKVAKPASLKYEMDKDFQAGLEGNPGAMEHYQDFSVSNKNEYLEWICEAKTAATKEKRITQILEWISEGKPRNWKYMKKYQ